MSGGPSFTVTWKLSRPIAPVAVSVPVQRTNVVPRWKSEPDNGRQLTTTGLPSVEVPVTGGYTTGAPSGLVASTVIGPGIARVIVDDVSTPTATVSDRQLSRHAPPARESTTCASVTSFQPGSSGASMSQLPNALARVVNNRGPTRRLTSANGSAQPGALCPGTQLPTSRWRVWPTLLPDNSSAEPRVIWNRGGGTLSSIRLVGVSASVAKARKCASISAGVAFAGGSGAWKK